MSSRCPILPLLAALILLPMGTGCLARQVTRDGVQMRQALLDMYTDQVMDNLMRAHDNMPFVQLTYGDVTVQDNDTAGGTANWSQGITDQVLPTVQRTVARMFGIEGTATRSRTMSFVANPVTDKNEIYDAYIEFAHDPARFVVSCNDPKGAAHIVRKHNKLYYWVPAEAGKDFLDLTMKTTFKRGPESAPPSAAYEVTIVAANTILTNPKVSDQRFAKLTFSGEVPNGDATLVAKLTDGRVIKMDLLQLNTEIKDGKEVPIKRGAKTSVLETMSWSPKAQGYNENNLIGAKARIYSQDFPPDAPAPAPQAVQRIRSDVNFIRNQQTQSTR